MAQLGCEYPKIRAATLKLPVLAATQNVFIGFIIAVNFANIEREVVEALQKLRPRRLAILTNGNAEMLDKSVVRSGLHTYLDVFLSADTVRVFKPNPEVYQLAVDSFGVNKSEILFVSSNAWDIAGAKSFGFTVGWIHRLNKPFEQLGIHADYTVSNLLELVQQIEKE